MTRNLVIAAALGLAACASAPPPQEFPPAKPARLTANQRELAVFMSFMPGTFDSIDHGKGPGVGTRMRIAPFWEERRAQGEHWFYVELARIADDPRPFRQRIYRFTAEGGKFAADIFALPGDARDFVGEWRKSKPFAAYSPAQLREYRGCRLGLGHMTIQFWARTEGKACRAEDASVTHEVTAMRASAVGMQYGIQGYDPAGKQISGEAGIWDFRRMAPVPR